MRIGALIALITLAAFVIVEGQSSEDARLQAQLKQLFPSATSFSAKGGNPPHFKAFSGQGQSTVMGYVFWTTDLQPLERGYDGPIKMLVGLDTKGLITGVIVTEHHEPYGDFSVDTPNFSSQFKSKDIRDAFKVGSDVDAISRATITVTSATRAIRNSARRVARAFLTPPSSSSQ